MDSKIRHKSAEALLLPSVPNSNCANGVKDYKGERVLTGITRECLKTHTLRVAVKDPNPLTHHR